MRIAVLSGKGGAGKTFIAVNLACVSDDALYIDCDAEEPNGHLFLKPEALKRESVFVSVPEWNQTLCNGCRRCVDFCRYNALAMIKNRLLIFKELCHACGGCMILCPRKALTERPREIGHVENGRSGNVSVLTGYLNPGEVSAVPVIKAVLGRTAERADVVIDCPPGSACTVMESIRDADFCILVAESTVFGVDNLGMVHDLVKLFGKPFGAVISKRIGDEDPAKEFCVRHGIPILAEFPYDRRIAALNSNGTVAVRADARYAKRFRALLSAVKERTR